MTTCKGCKHWNKDGKRHYWYTSSGEQMTAPHAVCGKIILLDEHDRSQPQTPPVPFTKDAEDYKADLWTPPQHYCSLHGPREQPE